MITWFLCAVKDVQYNTEKSYSRASANEAAITTYANIPRVDGFYQFFVRVVSFILDRKRLIALSVFAFFSAFLFFFYFFSLLSFFYLLFSFSLLLFQNSFLSQATLLIVSYIWNPVEFSVAQKSTTKTLFLEIEMVLFFFNRFMCFFYLFSSFDVSYVLSISS